MLRNADLTEAIPLSTAALCSDCEMIFRLERGECPCCGSREFVLLSQTVLQDR